MEVYFQRQCIFRDASVYEAQILRQNLVEDKSAQCGLYILYNRIAIPILTLNTYCNSGVKCDDTIFISKNCFVYILKELAFSCCTRSFLSQVVNTKYHIL